MRLLQERKHLVHPPHGYFKDGVELPNPLFTVCGSLRCLQLPKNSVPTFLIIVINRVIWGRHSAIGKLKRNEENKCSRGSNSYQKKYMYKLC